MSTSRKHPHKYERIDTNMGKIWRCAFSDCTHYMPKHMEWNLTGRIASCNECESEYVLTYEKMKSNQPICDECETLHEMRRRKLEEMKSVNKDTEATLDNLLKEIQ